jgi:predicted aminopeptidase
VLLVITGCNTVGYYAQSVGGQWEVLDKRQPISVLLDNPDTPESLREKLQTILRIRDFATQALKLPDNDSYRGYADLQRPYVVWNVFAAPSFELELQKWCFPFAGCVAYRGYFAKADAQLFAAQLNSEGLETYVSGVAAYSTLGWFDDPVLNTILNRSEARIAGLIFHELAHQQLYVEGDTAFNEAFAVTVELEGIRRWLALEGDPQQAEAYALFRQRQDGFVTLVTKSRDQLEVLYGQTLGDPEKQKRKTIIQARLREQYASLKQQWGGYAGYDEWFARDLNNAQLGAVTTYRDHVPALQRLLEKQGGDLAAFYRACEQLGELPEDERAVVLREMG